MSMSLSPNTQAILLLTAPLIAGRDKPSSDLLAPASTSGWRDSSATSNGSQLTCSLPRAEI
jgi:hypothetical protein